MAKYLTALLLLVLAGCMPQPKMRWTDAPVSSSMSFDYIIENDSDVLIEIYDVRGNKLATLIDAFQSAGSHTAVWNQRDESGQPVASGVYFYRIIAGEDVTTKKFALIK